MTGTIDIPMLETDRFRLRGPAMADFDAYARFRAGGRNAGIGGPVDRGVAFREWGYEIGQWSLRGYGRWTVTAKENDAALGLVGIFHPEDWPEAEIGWCVFDGAEGRGVAQEAAEATRNYAYDVLGWNRIISCILATNNRSVALAERLGARHESDFSHPSIGAMQVWRHRPPEAVT